MHLHLQHLHGGSTERVRSGGLELPGQYIPEVTIVCRVGEVSVDDSAEDLCLGSNDLEYVVLDRVLGDEVDARSRLPVGLVDADERRVV